MQKKRNIMRNILTKLICRFGADATVLNSTIFKSIPHRRVNAGVDEIFDLYQLGNFSAPSSSFFQKADTSDEIQENIELVQLQPAAKYRPHYHKNSSAVIYIIAGFGSFLLGEQSIDYQPGKRIVIPSGFMHGFNTLTPTLFLSIQSPPIINPVTGQIDLHYHNEELA